MDKDLTKLLEKLEEEIRERGPIPRFGLRRMKWGVRLNHEHRRNLQPGTDQRDAGVSGQKMGPESDADERRAGP